MEEEEKTLGLERPKYSNAYLLTVCAKCSDLVAIVLLVNESYQKPLHICTTLISVYL